MPSIGTLGSTLSLGPKSLKVKCQVFPHNGSTGLKWPTPANPPITDNHHRAGAKSETGCGREVQEFLGWQRGYLLCPDLLLQSLIPLNLHHFECYRKNNYKNTHPSTSLLLGWINIFPPVFAGPGVSYSLIGKRSLPTFKILHIDVLTEDALKLSFGGKLTIFTSHQVKQFLNGRGHLWVSDQRIYRYQVVLMENPGLTISPCEVLNPATLLPIPKDSFPFHCCLETLDRWTKPWEGLSEDALTNPEEIWYADGCNFSLDGKRIARYAVVSNFKSIEPKPLPPGTSAQLAELIALTPALELGKGKNSSHLCWLQVCLSGATCTCCYLERKSHLTTRGSPVKYG